MSDLITDLKKLPELAETHYDDFQVMRYMLQEDDDIDDDALDAYVEEIAAPIIEAIDCTQCGNCCMSLRVYLEAGDIERLADGLYIPLEDVKTNYVDYSSELPEDKHGYFQHSPCVFLNDKCCSIYDHRPETCRAYPQFTPQFRWLLADTIAGANTCPIIYNVLSELVTKIDAFQAGK